MNKVFAVDRFIDYLYNFDSGPRTQYTSPLKDDPFPRDFEIHAEMVQTRRKTQSPHPESVKRNLHFTNELERITAEPDMQSLLEVVPPVYATNNTSSPPQQARLFDLQSSLVEAWDGMSTQQVQALDKERLKEELFGKHPEFSLDLLRHHSRAATPKAPRQKLLVERDQELELKTSPAS